MKYAKLRGLRNNNPGNLKHGEQWQGMAPQQTDSTFITFISPEYGIRAMAKVLKNYQSRYGLDTIEEIVSRWAPPAENNTVAYIDNVYKQTGVPRTNPPQIISVADLLPRLIPAMIKQENGVQPYDASTINRGIELA